MYWERRAVWPSGCAVVISAFPAGSPPGVEGDATSSSVPSSDSADSSGESESCSATAEPGGVSICSASTDAVAASTFGGGTTSVLIGTGGGAVVDACPISVKLGGRGLSGGRHQMSCIVATHRASELCSENGPTWRIPSNSHTDSLLRERSVCARQHGFFGPKLGQRGEIFVVRRGNMRDCVSVFRNLFS